MMAQRQELFSMNELIEKFSIERVHSSGAKFDFEKAKWFNHEWIKKSDSRYLAPFVKDILSKKDYKTEDEKLLHLVELVKDRCTLLTDFEEQVEFLFCKTC